MLDICLFPELSPAYDLSLGLEYRSQTTGQAGHHPCPTPHREVLEGSEEEQDAKGSGEVAWLWVCHGSLQDSSRSSLVSLPPC